MVAVGAGLDAQRNETTGIAPCFGITFRLDRELINRIDWDRHAGNTCHASLVGRRVVLPDVIVVRAVNLPVILIGTRAVDRPSTVIARRDLYELREITAVKRNIRYRLVADNSVSGRRLRVQRKRVRTDLYRLRGGRHREPHHQRIDLTWPNGNSTHFLLHKAIGIHLGAVIAKLQVLERELASAGRHGVAGEASIRANENNFGIGDNGAGRVSNCPRHAAAKCLSGKQKGQAEKGKNAAKGTTQTNFIPNLRIKSEYTSAIRPVLRRAGWRRKAKPGIALFRKSPQRLPLFEPKSTLGSA